MMQKSNFEFPQSTIYVNSRNKLSTTSCLKNKSTTWYHKNYTPGPHKHPRNEILREQKKNSTATKKHTNSFENISILRQPSHLERFTRSYMCSIVGPRNLKLTREPNWRAARATSIVRGNFKFPGACPPR